MSNNIELTDEQAASLLAETNAVDREILFDKQVVPAIVESFKVRPGNGERDGEVTIQVTYQTEGDTVDNYGTTYPPGEKHTVFFMLAAPTARRKEADVVKRVARETKDLARLGKACGTPLEGAVSLPWLNGLVGRPINLGLTVYSYTSKKTGEDKNIQEYAPNPMN